MRDIADLDVANPHPLLDGFFDGIKNFSFIPNHGTMHSTIALLPYKVTAGAHSDLEVALILELLYNGA